MPPEKIVGSTELNERAEWIDWLRIGSAIGIVLLHITVREKVRLFASIGPFDWWVISLYETITRLAVPIFFLISGALIVSRCGTEDPWGYVIPKAKRILWVLIIWTQIFGCWEYLKDDVSSPFSLVFQLPVGRTYYHLWFLLALLGCYVVAPALRLVADDCIRKKNFIAFLVPVVISVDYSIASVYGSHDYFRTSFLSVCIPYIGLFLSGYLCYQEWHSRNKYATILLVASLLLALFSFAALRHLRFDQHYEKVLLPLSPFIWMASVCTFALVKHNSDSLPRLPGFMKRISRDCVGIYLVHPVPLDVLNHLGLLGRYPNLLIGIPILTVVVVVSSIGMVRIIRTLKLDRILFP